VHSLHSLHGAAVVAGDLRLPKPAQSHCLRASDALFSTAAEAFGSDFGSNAHCRIFICK
jgi:hypothetical protein